MWYVVGTFVIMVIIMEAQRRRYKEQIKDLRADAAYWESIVYPEFRCNGDCATCDECDA